MGDFVSSMKNLKMDSFATNFGHTLSNTDRLIAKRRWAYAIVPTILILLMITSIRYAMMWTMPGLSTLKEVRFQNHEPACREIYHQSEQCEFVRLHCLEDDAGIFSYLSLYFCGFSNIKPFSFVALIGWLGILFASIGISASDFLCINLATMSDMLGMSQTLAGVTLLAFGNGSPDVFSTWAAFTTHNGSLAVGELIGAANFITAVVAGSMALVKPFRVSRKSFVRDASFFTVASAFSLVCLIDGHLTLWESAVMVLFYLFYVATVLLWHSFSHRQKARKDQQSRARGHFEAIEPLLDSTEPGHRNPSQVSLDHLNISQEIDLSRTNRQGSAKVLGPDNTDMDDDEADRERFLSEMGEEIRRTHRRTLSRMATSSQPIRASLLGALEFGSVLAHLERSRNYSGSRLPVRRHSEHTASVVEENPTSTPVARSSSHHAPFLSRDLAGPGNSHMLTNETISSGSRGRAVSASATLSLDTMQPSRDLLSDNQEHQRNPPPPNSLTIGSVNDGARSPVPTIILNESIMLDPNHISEDYIDDVQPFPVYTDDPLDDSRPEFVPITNQGLFPRWFSRNETRRYGSKVLALLPSARDVTRTLFPTLEEWPRQNWFARMIAVLTLPTVLILTITVPVVHKDWQAECLEHRDTNRETTLVRADAAEADQSSEANVGDVGRGRDRIFCGDRLNLPAEIDATVVNRRSAGEHETQNACESVAAIENDSVTLWKPWLVALQIFLSPLFLLLAFFADDIGGLAKLSIWVSILLSFSLLVFLTFVHLVSPQISPWWQGVLAFPGFCVSIAWISLIAGEVVSVLKAIGVITQISDAILGLTVFAIGNSLSDLLANLAIARLGYPVMALSACFGGPMLNILLGIGLGGLSMTIKKGHKHSHGGAPPVTTHFGIQIGRPLIISGATLLITLAGLLIFVPMNGWVMDRKIGLALISLWSFTTLANVFLEIIVDSRA